VLNVGVKLKMSDEVVALVVSFFLGLFLITLYIISIDWTKR